MCRKAKLLERPYSWPKKGKRGSFLLYESITGVRLGGAEIQTFCEKTASNSNSTIEKTGGGVAVIFDLAPELDLKTPFWQAFFFIFFDEFLDIWGYRLKTSPVSKQPNNFERSTNGQPCFGKEARKTKY